MDFDFSADAKELRLAARRFLDERAGTAVARRSMNGEASFDAALWHEIVELGWTAARVPEDCTAGSSLSSEAACVLAEEVGRSLVPVPLASVLAATEALILAGSGGAEAALAAGHRRRLGDRGDRLGGG